MSLESFNAETVVAVINLVVTSILTLITNRSTNKIEALDGKIQHIDECIDHRLSAFEDRFTEKLESHMNVDMVEHRNVQAKLDAMDHRLDSFIDGQVKHTHNKDEN